MDQLSIGSPFHSLIGMGESKTIYRQSVASKTLNVIGSLLFLFAAAYIFYYGLNYKNVYPDVAAANTPIIYGFAALLVGTGIYWAWNIFSRWQDMAVLYENGFAYFNGRDVTSFKWNEITSIKIRMTQLRVEHFIPAGKIRMFIFESPSAKLKLDGTLSKVEDLVKNIRANALSFMVPRLRQELNSGKILQFGPVSIHKAEGISIKKKKCAWNNIANVRVVNEVLEIVPRKNGLFGRLSANSWQVSNLDALFILSEEMIRQNSQVA